MSGITQRIKRRLTDLVARETLRQLAVSRQEHESLMFALGELQCRLLSQTRVSSLKEAEFRVFSQWGEDGIIQYLIGRVPIEREIFIEFGVGDYRESNTRFLMSHNNWRGVIIDSQDRHVEFLECETEVSNSWKYDIVALKALLNAENINSVISEADVTGDIGLLSVDVDGMDYWLLDALTMVSPRIVIVEYNSIFGPDAAVTVPYDPGFERWNAHFSGLYFGASLSALHTLLDRKGYAFVGCNGAGVNAFFIRRDVVGSLPTLTAHDGYVASQLRQSRDLRGNLTYVRTHQAQLRLIADQPLWDITEQRQVSVAERFGLAIGN